MTHMHISPVMRDYIGNDELEALARWHEARGADAERTGDPIALGLHQWRAERLRGWAQRGPWWAIEPDDWGCAL